MVEQNTLPTSSVPAAFADGHLYSPTADLVETGIDFRPGDQFEPMPPKPSGGMAEKAAWWRSVANLSAPDFLGLTVGSAITVHSGKEVSPGVVIMTFRASARVQVALTDDPDDVQMQVTVTRRSPSGHWYGPYCDTPES
ncbi:hypothetical protein ABT095_15210 [Kitasatospora sp. NPDC002227]|uniref:hypothetical protein n=1 Tax=Kitasatospora sp. NPDC002227 TaxID=3154773 RepID=UPI00331FEEEB